MSQLYISVSEIDDYHVMCDVESAIVFFVYKYLSVISDSNLSLNLLVNEQMTEKYFITVDISNFSYVWRKTDNLDDVLLNCRFPVYYSTEEKYCVAGLCAVLRQIVKVFKDVNWLLGFRQSGLSGCSEFSILTKFCEVDLISSLKKAVISHDSIVPVDIIRLENHLGQPVRTHNIGKINLSIKRDNSSPDDEVQHTYVEGPQMLLSDFIILPVIHIFLSLYSNGLVLQMPLIYKWYKLMRSQRHVENCLSVIEVNERCISSNELVVPEVKVESLYKCDPRRYKRSDKNFTKQEDVEYALNIVDSLEILKKYDYVDITNKENFCWVKVPYFAHPKGGSIPDARLNRKMQQLENIVKAVLEIAEEGDIVVDFCCGVGHVGILVAYLLPKCSILLLDNKEYSLKKALKRVCQLNLLNVSIMQSNIDYFIGNFQIGVSLHACGVVADIVIKTCTSNRSKFVIAPCCYGKLQKNHILDYPRSGTVKNSSLTERDYLVLGHCADQTHKKIYAKSDQGEKCMKIIDVDRCLQVEENSYYVTLSKMIPRSCSPKNNFIIGIPLEKYSMKD